MGLLTQPVVTRVLFASAARTTWPLNSGNVVNPGNPGVRFDVDITAIAGGNLVFKIQSWDPAKGAWIDELTSAALVATGRTSLQLHPEMLAVTNLVAQVICPKTLRLNITGTATSATFSVIWTFG